MFLTKENVHWYVGRNCKIVFKEDRDRTTSEIEGMIQNIDFDIGLVSIDSDNGLAAIEIQNILSIQRDFLGIK